MKPTKENIKPGTVITVAEISEARGVGAPDERIKTGAKFRLVAKTKVDGIGFFLAALIDVNGEHAGEGFWHFDSMTLEDSAVTDG